jgi:glycosyltransferase involved in cell wall biosynthesis
MKRHRIIFLTTHSSRGGTLDYIFALKRRFDASGHDTSVAALVKGGDHDPRMDSHVLAGPGPSGLLSYAVAALRFLGICLRSERSLIIGVMPLANVLSAFGGLVGRGRVMATHHNPRETHNKGFRIIDRIVGTMGLYDRIVCVSHTVARSFESYSQRYRRLIKVLLNGVKPLAEPPVSTAHTRERFGLAQDRAMVLMVGRLSTEKNVLRVIDAIQDIDGIQLVLAGDGPLKAEAEARIMARQLSDKVKLLGTVSKPEVAELLHACDVFVQVSVYEGNSLALLEAISARAAIVVSEVPAQREAITLRDGSLAAVLCDPQDPHEIARAIGQAAFDPAVRAQLSRNVQALAAQFRSEDEMLDDYELELKSLL